jgi:hypothetical protein
MHPVLWSYSVAWPTHTVAMPGWPSKYGPVGTRHTTYISYLPKALSRRPTMMTFQSCGVALQVAVPSNSKPCITLQHFE